MFYILFLDNIDHVRDAVVDMSADESYHLPTTGNEVCLKAARIMISSLQSPSQEARSFCDWLIQSLETVVNQSLSESSGCLKRERLWQDYYQLQVSTSFKNKWAFYLETLDLPAEPIFFQSCTQILFDNILKLKVPIPPTSNDSSASDTSFSFEEENAICYVGGYVVATLKKHEVDDEVLHGLDHLIEKDLEKVKADSATWLQEINRGGLTEITQEAQQLFMAIEASTRRHLTLKSAHRMDETTCCSVKNDVFADSDVQFSWCLTGMSLEVSEDRAEELLEMCIDKWITIRGFSFADSIQELFKQKDKKGTGKAKALRKTL